MRFVLEIPILAQGRRDPRVTAETLFGLLIHAGRNSTISGCGHKQLSMAIESRGLAEAGPAAIVPRYPWRSRNQGRKAAIHRPIKLHVL